MNNWNNSFCSNRQYLLSRRDILKGVSAGFGYMAFAGMSTAQAAANAPLVLAAAYPKAATPRHPPL